MWPVYEEIITFDAVIVPIESGGGFLVRGIEADDDPAPPTINQPHGFRNDAGLWCPSVAGEQH